MANAVIYLNALKVLYKVACSSNIVKTVAVAGNNQDCLEKCLLELSASSADDAPVSQCFMGLMRVAPVSLRPETKTTTSKKDHMKSFSIFMCLRQIPGFVFPTTDVMKWTALSTSVEIAQI